MLGPRGSTQLLYLFLVTWNPEESLPQQPISCFPSQGDQLAVAPAPGVASWAPLFSALKCHWLSASTPFWVHLSLCVLGHAL